MFTQPPVVAALETTVTIDGMDFERTDIPNGVDDSGLLVAKTLLTRGQAAHAAQRLQALRKSDRPITHGQMVMHKESGDADVVSWGDDQNSAIHPRYPERLREQLYWGGDDYSSLQTVFSGNLYLSRFLPGLDDSYGHTPVDVSWITSVALAAAKTEADTRFLVRLMSVREYEALIRYVYGDMSQPDINKMSVLRGYLTPDGRPIDPANQVPVVGPEADKRTRKGITDAFGYLWNWTGDLHPLIDYLDPEHLKWNGGYTNFPSWWRVLCGNSYFDQSCSLGPSPNTRIKLASYHCSGGLRLVAVPRP